MNARRLLRRIIITLVFGALLIALWCAVFWRWWPKVQTFEAGSASVSDKQFPADGSQPGELRRATSFEYSRYNLDAWLHLD